MFYISSLKYKLPRVKDKLYAYRIDGTMTAKFIEGGGSIPVNLGERSLAISYPVVNKAIGFAEFVSDNDFACYFYTEDEKDYVNIPAGKDPTYLKWFGDPRIMGCHFKFNLPKKTSNAGVYLEKDINKHIIKYPEVHACINLYQAVYKNAKTKMVRIDVRFPEFLSQDEWYQIKTTINGKEYINKDKVGRKNFLVFHPEYPIADLKIGFDKKTKISVYIKNLDYAGKYTDWTPIKIRLAHKTELKDAEEIIFLPDFDTTVAPKHYVEKGKYNTYTINLYEPEHEY